MSGPMVIAPIVPIGVLIAVLRTTTSEVWNGAGSSDAAVPQLITLFDTVPGRQKRLVRLEIKP